MTEPEPIDDYELEFGDRVAAEAFVNEIERHPGVSSIQITELTPSVDRGLLADFLVSFSATAVFDLAKFAGGRFIFIARKTPYDKG